MSPANFLDYISHSKSANLLIIMMCQIRSKILYIECIILGKFFAACP